MAEGVHTDMTFTTAHMSMRNNWTQGRIYEAIIDSERRGDYLGKTIQIIRTLRINESNKRCNQGWYQGTQRLPA